MLQQTHEHGHDVGAATRAIVTETPLSDSPARDLRYRIVARLKIPIEAPSPVDIDKPRRPRTADYAPSTPTVDRRRPPTGR